MSHVRVLSLAFGFWLLVVPGKALGTARLLIPMDLNQSNHLRAYGVMYWSLQRGYRGEWLLNYRGGSFLLDDAREIAVRCRVQGVSFERAGPAHLGEVYATIAESNMEVIKLEKAPRVAVYTPPSKQPWDDAVTLALTYADIPFEKIWDTEVLSGSLGQYDWLHLHHEDFTGQYSKFHRNFHGFTWYQDQKKSMEGMASELGFVKVSELKKAVALAIRTYVDQGGFLFAMCCAPNTLDIALASAATDICAAEYDGDKVDPGYESKLNFGLCFAFENFSLHTHPGDSRHGNIDVNHVNTHNRIEAYDFTLFDFSAKYDPVPCMLVQNHVNYIKGFFGLATSFNPATLKKSVTILGQVEGEGQIRYIHGNLGRGQFCFYGGHDPEDYAHEIGSPPTDLSRHPNSPGYRLILNNVLFPSARKKKLKT